MERSRSVRLFVIWLLMVAGVEAFGLVGYALHAGWFGGIGPVTPGPIRVLIVDEATDYSKPEYRPYLPVLNSAKITSYLRSHCIKVKGTAEWRHWSQETDIENESGEWKALMAMPRAKLPWLIIEKGHQHFSGPLPSTVDDTLALLKKWGGE